MSQERRMERQHGGRPRNGLHAGAQHTAGHKTQHQCPWRSKEPTWVRDGRSGPEPLGQLLLWSACLAQDREGAGEEDHGQVLHVALLATGVWAAEWGRQMGSC